MDGVPCTYIPVQMTIDSVRLRSTIGIFEPTAHCKVQPDSGHIFNQRVTLFDDVEGKWLGLDARTGRHFLFLKHIEMHRNLRVFVIFDTRNGRECVLLERYKVTNWCPAVLPVERAAHGVICVEYSLERTFDKCGMVDELPLHNTRWRETFGDKVLVYFSSHDGSDNNAAAAPPKELTDILEPIRWEHCDKCDRLTNDCRVTDVGPMPGATMNVCFACIPPNDTRDC